MDISSLTSTQTFNIQDEGKSAWFAVTTVDMSLIIFSVHHLRCFGRRRFGRWIPGIPSANVPSQITRLRKTFRETVSVSNKITNLFTGTDAVQLRLGSERRTFLERIFSLDQQWRQSHNRLLPRRSPWRPHSDRHVQIRWKRICCRSEIRRRSQVPGLFGTRLP